jgi:hypothetical protein
LPKRFTSPLRGLLAAAFLSGLLGAAPIDLEGEKRLRAAAEFAHDAFFSLESTRLGLDEAALVVHRGFFISAEGLAIIPLQAFDGGQFNTSLESNRTPILIEGVVAADLKSGLAIVRTDHQPAVWLPLPEKDLHVGDRVAIYRTEAHGGTVTAPILARRKAAFSRSQAYSEVFSIAANLGDLGSTHAPAGTPVLDEGGRVAAVLSGPSIGARQRFLFGFPISALRSLLPEDAGAAPIIPFPLPTAYRPVDPLAMDTTYLLGRRAQVSGAPVDAERLLRKALAKEPKSAAGWERLGFVLRELGNDKEAMDAFDRAAQFGNNLGGFELNRADQLRLQGDLEAAAKVLHTACTTTPFDYDLHRAYAIALRSKRDEAGAEKHLRISTEIAPDALSCWELLSQCLAAQGKWEDEKDASDKIYELESLYRPR